MLIYAFMLVVWCRSSIFPLLPTYQLLGHTLLPTDTKSRSGSRVEAGEEAGVGAGEGAGAGKGAGAGTKTLPHTLLQDGVDHPGVLTHF